MTDLIGKLLGQYRLIRKISESNYSLLYLAEDSPLHRDVLLQILHFTRGIDSSLRASFLDEIKSFGSVHHPGIATILDFGEQDGKIFVVTEYFSGGSLEEKIGKPMPWREAAQTVQAIAITLGYLHEQDLLHRDIGPNNIWFTQAGTPVLIGFGIVRLVEQEETRDTTVFSVGIASPYYMSPEQGSGQPTDQRSEVYSLGILFYELLTGRRPYIGETPMEIVVQQVSNDLPRPSRHVPGLPDQIEQVILRAISKDPSHRFQNMQQLAYALDEILKGRNPKIKVDRKEQIEPKPRHLSPVLLALPVVFVAVFFGLNHFLRFLPYTRQHSPWSITPTLIEPVAIPSATMKARVATEFTPEPTIFVPSPQPTPTAMITYPLLLGSTFSPPVEPITAESLPAFIELARLGYGKFTDVRWSPDGETLAVSTSGAIMLFSADELHPERFIDAGGWVTALEFARDGSFIAAGTREGRIRFWDPNTGQSTTQIEAHDGAITAMWLTDTHLYSASVDRSIKIWSLANASEPVRVIRGHGRGVLTIAVTEDELYLFSGSEDGSAKRWNLMGNSPVADRIYPGCDSTTSITVTKDGKYIALGCKSGRVLYHDAFSTNILLDPTRLEAPISSLAFSLEENFLIVGVENNTIDVINLETNRLRLARRNFGTLPVSAGYQQDVGTDFPFDMSVATSPEGDRVAVASWDGTLSILRIMDSQVLVTLPGTYQYPLNMNLAHNSQSLVVGVAGSQALVLDLPSLSIRSQAAGQLVVGEPISRDDSLFVVEKNGQLLGLSMETGKVVKEFQESFLSGSYLFTDKDQMLIDLKSNDLRAWDVASQLPIDLPKQSRTGCYLAKSADTRVLAAYTSAGLISDWQDIDYRLCDWIGNERWKSAAISWDHHLIAYATDNQQVDLYNAVENLLIWKSERLSQPVTRLTFSPDRSLLVAGLRGGGMVFLRVSTGQVLKLLNVHYGDVNFVFSRDGKFLVSAGADGTARIWGIPND